MIIERLEINNFGKLKSLTVPLYPGINVICGENESGKSTLHTFVRSMLFGAERLRGKGARTDIYNRCEPWENPAYYGGNMEFSCGGKRFRLERDFHKMTERARLVGLEDGELLDVERGDLRMLIGDINEGIFDNTVSVGQLKSVTGRELSRELSRYIANYRAGADENINPEEALQILRGQRRAFLGDKKRRDEELQRMVHEIQAKMELLEQEQESCRRKMEELQETSAGQSQKDGGGFGGLLRSLWRAVLRILRRLLGKASPSGEASGGEQPGERSGKLAQLREEWQERGILLENLRQEKLELEESRCERGPADEEIEALELAMETLERTIDSMQRGVGARLLGRMGEILGELTGGKYTCIQPGENREIRLRTLSRAVELHQLSRGTLEQVYFALRMAAEEALCAREPLPLLLDDTFAMYDEGRLARTLCWLAENREQVILFTCHRREEELLAREGISCHVYALDR